MVSQRLPSRFTEEAAVGRKERLRHPGKTSVMEVPGAGSHVFVDWEQCRLKQDASLNFET